MASTDVDVDVPMIIWVPIDDDDPYPEDCHYCCIPACDGNYSGICNQYGKFKIKFYNKPNDDQDDD
jgi:hypothetical protein